MMSGHSRIPSRFHLATGLLIAGVILLTISTIIYYGFLEGSGFKAEYRVRQVQRCVEAGNLPTDCERSFR